MRAERVKTIKVDYLARVEGEGALHIKLNRHGVQDIKLKIFEPPRFFEAFLRGRACTEAPDITARICGICPVAYQMSAVHAIEDAFGVQIPEPIRELRRLLYCGEWIESHTLHVYMLHAPDFLGYQDALQIANIHPEIVAEALRLKKIGNQIVTVVGGREIHPINVRVGGFYKLPSKRALADLAEELKWAREAARAMVKFAAGLEFPAFERDYTFVALRHAAEYPMNEGRLVSSAGHDLALNEYEIEFREEHVAHSNALHSLMRNGEPYLVGPLARFNLNFDKLSPLAQEDARAAGLAAGCRNPFQSIIVRSIETLYACDEALRIIENYAEPEAPAVPFDPAAGVGYGCTEAPRGILYHRYRIDRDGRIRDAKIVPPTSQNQATIEADLRAFVPDRLDLPHEKLVWVCEQAVRNYDPCISCATHFLRVHVEQEVEPAPA